MCDPPLSTVLATYACPRLKEHASADMHCSVMIPFKKKRAANPCDYAPIAKALGMLLPCKKTARKFQHASEISRYFIMRAHAIFRQLFCALICRITGASARANYRVYVRTAVPFDADVSREKNRV